MTLGCLIKDYFPDPVNVIWHSNSPNMSTVNFPALGSELKVTTSQVTTKSKSAKTFTCQVTHAPSGFNSNKTIKGKQGWAGYRYRRREHGQSRKDLSYIPGTEGQGCAQHPRGSGLRPGGAQGWGDTHISLPLP